MRRNSAEAKALQNWFQERETTYLFCNGRAGSTEKSFDSMNVLNRKLQLPLKPGKKYKSRTNTGTNPYFVTVCSFINTLFDQRILQLREATLHNELRRLKQHHHTWHFFNV